MIAETGTYYLIGYSSPAPPYDGKRHRIKVRTRESGPQVRARESYISPRRAPQAKAAPVRDRRAGRGPDPIARFDDARSRRCRRRWPPSPARPSRSGSSCWRLMPPAPRASISRLVAVDSDGKVHTRQRFRSTFEAKGAAPAGWTRLGSRVDVPPGRYQIRLAAVGGNGAGGSVFTEVTVPKFTERPGDRRAVARVARVAHREAGRADRERPAAGAAADPGVPGGDPARRTTADSRHGGWRHARSTSKRGC